jgi:hypothetical protein
MTLRRRLDRLEAKADALFDQRLAALSDEELNAILDEGAPPGTKPAREWSDTEVRAMDAWYSAHGNGEGAPWPKKPRDLPGGQDR